MKKAAVILSGCGVYDGAEIYESVFTLLALDQADVSYQCFAPDKPQAHVVDHSTGNPADGESRNVLVEASRLARGEIKPLSEANPDDFDVVLLPGGFGAAKNLCTFAFDGADMKVDAEVESFVKRAHELGKPLAFACIAPAVAAKVFGEAGLKFTIGNDAGTAEALSTWGAKHEDCAVDEVVVDESLKIVTTPAYMLAGRIREAHEGLSKMVEAVLKL